MRGRTGPGYVLFRDGTRQVFDQPLDTLDPRYSTCTDHHVGCICREAEWSEDLNEYRSEWNAFRNALKAVLTGHAACCCQCSGCEIARRLNLIHLATGEHCND